MTKFQNLVAISLSLLALGFFATRNSAPTTGLRTFASIDRSGSAQDILKKSVRMLVGMAAWHDPKRDLLVCYRTDNKTQEWYSNPAPTNPESFQSLAIDALKEDAGSKGTRPALYFQEVARRLAGDSDSRPITILFFWDGGNDDMTAEGARAFDQAVHQLSSDHRVALVGILGVHDRHRAEVRRRFEQFGHRFWMCGPGEMDLGPLLKRLGELRHSAPTPPKEELQTVDNLGRQRHS